MACGPWGLGVMERSRLLCRAPGQDDHRGVACMPASVLHAKVEKTCRRYPTPSGPARRPRGYLAPLVAPDLEENPPPIESRNVLPMGIRPRLVPFLLGDTSACSDLRAVDRAPRAAARRISGSPPSVHGVLFGGARRHYVIGSLNRNRSASRSSCASSACRVDVRSPRARRLDDAPQRA